jgi:hypothetical protein
MISENNRERDKPSYDFASMMDSINGKSFSIDDTTGQDCAVSTFGVSKIEIPMAQIILAIFSRIFLGLKNRWELTEDRDLMQKVLKRKIPAIFRIEDTFDTLMEILDVRALEDVQLEAPNFITDLNAMINGLPLSDGYIQAIEEMRRTLKGKIDEIYLNHGPFFALKIFEADIYGKYLDYLLSQIKNKFQQVNAEDVSKLAKYYAALKPGLFRKNEKARLRIKLLDAVEAYAQSRVYLLWEKQINDFKTEISRDYHEGLFKPVTSLVTFMGQRFRDSTGIDSYTEEHKTTDAAIFTWNFSDASYNNIYDKINSHIDKKIVWMDPGNPTPVETFTKGKIFRAEEGRVNKDRELLYWAKGEEPIEVEYYDEQQKATLLRNVIAIEEVMQFGNEKIISLEQMIKCFLMDVKHNPDRDIYEIMLSDFREIMDVFNRMSFADMIILCSLGVDFSKPASDEQKKNLFKKAIEKYCNNALPSFPVSGKYVQDLLISRGCSFTLKPEFTEEYNAIINSIQIGFVPRANSNIFTKKGLLAMITVNFHFDYGFHMYRDIERCKAEYDEIIDTPGAVGLHIAEGEEDIRPHLRELV